MSEALPPAPEATLYAPRPTGPVRPGMTPLGAIALVMGGVSIILLGTLMSGNSIPGIRAVAAQPAVHATHKPVASAQPSASASPSMPEDEAVPVEVSDEDIHVAVRQATRDQVAAVKAAQAAGDNDTLLELAEVHQEVAPDGGVLTTRVLFGGDGTDTQGNFWAMATALDSTGNDYTYAYSSHDDKYITTDPTIGSFTR
jgi:hypothetical protein